MFREHIAYGAVVSMVVVVGTYFYAWMTDPLLLAILFTLTVVGSFLPDVDSDSGMPFYLVFGTMSLIATGFVLLYMLNRPTEDLKLLVGIPLGALFFTWVVVGGIVKKFTCHRGIFHSIPATLIAGLGTILIAQRYGVGAAHSLIYGVGMAVGYLTHLVLDELHSGINLDGIPFIPKKSLGTALKFFSDSKGVNMATYALLATLMYTVVESHTEVYTIALEFVSQF